MALETLCSNELLNFIIYDTISATPFTSNDSSQTITAATNPCNTFLFHLQNSNPNPNLNSISPRVAETATAMEIMSSDSTLITTTAKMSMAVQSYCNRDDNNSYVNLGVQKKKRRRSSRVCKNKEEAETQRMTHIAVERNRRKQMNEHLAVLRSLMPESYVQRGDQASIVGGAIEFVKELEHLLQTLEAQKYQEQEVVGRGEDGNFTNISGSTTPPPFSQFFTYPQYTSCQIPNKYTSKSKAAIADIEVTLIETHANVRILSRKRLAQLSKMVACFQTLHLSVLHINVTTLDPLVLYSISVKVEEGCRLNSADEIAGAVHHMLRIIEEEAAMPLSFVDSIN